MSLNRSSSLPVMHVSLPSLFGFLGFKQDYGVFTGCSLQKLWAGLQGSEAATEIPLDARSKQLVWQQVLNVPGIGFRRSKSPGSQTLDPSHLSVKSVEEAQGLGVFVVAPEGLRESCLGMYDVKLCDAHLSKDQRDILEHLAKARFATDAGSTFVYDSNHLMSLVVRDQRDLLL